MTKERFFVCQDCGQELQHGRRVGYSERVYEKALALGVVLQPYCESCRTIRHDQLKSRGAPRFYVPTVQAFRSLGQIKQPYISYQVVETPDTFDPARFGLTAQKIQELAAWFSNPRHRVAILDGPTASGKSTALPYWLMNIPEGIGVAPDFFTRYGQILHTQPRQGSTRGQTLFVGEQLMGGTVGPGFDTGYAFSGEYESDHHNLWQSRTDGLFKNQLLNNDLSHIGLVIVDEVQERSVNIDEILRLLVERLTLYRNLRLMISSATADTSFFFNYFGAGIAKVITLEEKVRRDAGGKPIAYEQFFADRQRALPYEDLTQLSRLIVSAAVKKALWIVDQIRSGQEKLGDILVFLPGAAPINEAIDRIRRLMTEDYELAETIEAFPLYRGLPESQKRQVTQHDISDGKIWLIFCTNIVEVSYTIDSVAYEVETGLENQAVFRPETASLKLILRLIGRGNARQRWGRTGRTRRGKVYCTYTHWQFENLFPASSPPAILSSNMESTLLAMASAGIASPETGWPNDPPKAEVQRAYAALLQAGALDQQHQITKRGLVLQRFSYQVKLVDALFAADTTGCTVELASILPVVRNGGYNRLFRWRYSWDPYAKLQAFQRHRSLAIGCQDDIEFILKIVKSWLDLPWIAAAVFERLTFQQLKALRYQWADYHYLNTEALEAIAAERAAVLDGFSDKNKERGLRGIDLRLAPRVRLLITHLFNEVEYCQPNIPYQFHPLVPQINSSIACRCLPPAQTPTSPLWLTPDTSRDSTDARMQYSRLFMDQFYPAGGRFQADTILKRNNVLQRVGHIQRPYQRPIPSLRRDDADYQVGACELQTLLATVRANDSEEEETALYWMDNLPMDDQDITVQLIPHEKPGLPSSTYEVIGYRPDAVPPAVLVRSVPLILPFSHFTQLFREGMEVFVEVVQVLSYPNDSHPSLMVREPQSGLEILMESRELGFSSAAIGVTAIPVGTRLCMRYERTDQVLQQVYLSLLPAHEQKLSMLFAEFAGQNTAAKEVVVSGHVAEKRHDSLVLMLDWAQPEQGFIPVTTIYEEVLPRSIDSYTLDETLTVMITRRPRRAARIALASLPEQAVQLLKSSGITYTDRHLRAENRIPQELRQQLKRLGDSTFQQAIDKLYWLTNCLATSQVMDQSWLEIVRKDFPLGFELQAEVKTVEQQRVYLHLNGVTAYVAKRLQGIDPRCNLPRLFAPGDRIYARVAEHHVAQKQLILAFCLERQLQTLTVGQVVQATVINTTDYGVFVRVAPGISGLIHRKGMSKKVKNLSEHFPVGRQFQAQIVSTELDRVELSLSIKPAEQFATTSPGPVAHPPVVTVTVPEPSPIEKPQPHISIWQRIWSFLRNPFSRSPRK